jgi:hypothetical protein
MSCAVRLLSRRQTRGWNTAIEQERLDSRGVVVVGVDGSPTSLRAAAYGIGLARRQSARVVFVYARRYPMTLPGLGPDLSDGLFHRVAGSSLSGRLTRSRHWPVIIVP